MPKPTFSPIQCFVGKMGDDPSAAWKNEIKWYSENHQFKELNRIDGLQAEFEWIIFPGFVTEEIQKIYGRLYSVNLSSSTVKSSSCQCATTLYGGKTETHKGVNTIHRDLRSVLVDSLVVVGISWDLDQKRNGTELSLMNPTEIGTELQK